MEMKSFYPKGNWVKRKSRIKESVESLIKWVFEKTVRKSWQNRWEDIYEKRGESATNDQDLSQGKPDYPVLGQKYCKLRSNRMPVPLLRNGYSIFNGTKYR